MLDRYGDDWPGMMAVLERQFGVLHNRSQVLLTLCGIVVSTTGFSGRLVAGTNVLSQALIVSGLAFILASAGVVVLGVLHLRWLTMQGGETPAAWLVTSLAYRDRKTKFYRVGIVLLLIGLILYGGSLAVTLLNPEEDALPPRSRVPTTVARASCPCEQCGSGEPFASASRRHGRDARATAGTA